MSGRVSRVVCFGLVLLVGLAGCDDTTPAGVGIGGSCTSNDDCRAGLVCTDNVCSELAVGDTTGDTSGDGDAGGDASADTNDTSVDVADADAPGDADVANDSAVDSDLDVAADMADADAMGDIAPDMCDDVPVSVELVTSTLVVLVDQSGSMTDDFGGISRWDALNNVLFDAQTGLVWPVEDRIHLGLSLYSNDRMNTCPDVESEPPSLMNGATMQTLYGDNAPLLDTPTGDSLAAVLPQLAGSAGPGPKAILLISDGEPDRCDDPDAHDEVSHQLVVDAAVAAFQSEVETYVLSMGDQISLPHLQEIANAGRGLPVDGSFGNAPYYEAIDSTQLSGAIDLLLGSAQTCVYQLDSAATVMIPQDGIVTVNGTEISNLSADGWRFHNDPMDCYGAEQCIVLAGALCTALRDGAPTVVTARWPCTSVTTD